MILISAATLVLLSALAGLAWIDWHTFRLPDWLTLPLIPAGLLANHVLFSSLWTPLIGAAIGYLALVGLELGYKAVRKRDGLGRGDAKLLAAGGAWCGAWLLPFILLVASLSALAFVLAASLIRRRLPDSTQALAFGPWIALAIAIGWVHRAFGPGLIPGG